MRPVIACHCNQCRKTSGHYVAASAAHKDGVEIVGADRITWFASSDGARRGFCMTCGSHLFWDVHASDTLSIFAGSIDGETGLSIKEHIYCANKGDYYELGDASPRFAGASGGAGYP